MDVDALQDDPLMIGGGKRDSFTLGNDPISFDDDANMAGDSAGLIFLGRQTTSTCRETRQTVPHDRARKCP